MAPARGRTSVTSLTTGMAARLDDVADYRRTLAAEFERCSDALYRFFAVRTGGDTHLADDFMQQLWLQAAEGRADIPRDELEFWLRAIARNLVQAHWRRTARRPDSVPIVDEALAAQLSRSLGESELPTAALERREVRDQLLLALTELSASEQALIIGHYFDGRALAELAEECGVTARAVEGRLYRARQSLRRRLEHLS